jgi:diaminopimelate epimerase
MLRFAKMEGCGNDFLVVDVREGGPAHAADPSPERPEAAVALCDRHFGVGGDGVLVVSAPTATGAVARMRVLNADGSEAEMCGNGIRCVTKYLYERDARLRQPELAIETGAGVLRCGVTLDGRRHVTHVSVAMGRPRTERAAIPITGPADERVVEQELSLAGRTFRMTCVSMGNPHAVLFLDGDEPLRPLAERYGPSLERHEWFPRRTNAEFARVRRTDGPAEIDLVVWERGCGITLACGTGACATAVAACLTGRARPGVEIPVHLLGGTLAITVAPDLSGVTMRGPAEEVLEAEIDLAALLRRRPAAAPRT